MLPGSCEASSSSQNPAITVGSASLLFVHKPTKGHQLFAAKHGSICIQMHHSIISIWSQDTSHASRALQSALHMPEPLTAVADHGPHAVLCCARRTGTLSTVASDGPAAGFPSGSVVEYAPDEQGRPVFMISSISPHTKHLKKDSRCSFTVLAPAFRVRAPFAAKHASLHQSAAACCVQAVCTVSACKSWCTAHTRQNV